jgi:hypothetical protein
MSNPRLSEYGTPYRFSGENRPANRGRKPSKLKKWIKENGVSKCNNFGITPDDGRFIEGNAFIQIISEQAAMEAE